MEIIEIGCPNIPVKLRQYKLDDHWVAYNNPEKPSAPMSYAEAIQVANNMQPAGAVGFLVPGPEPVPVVKPDYSKPLPSVLSRKKQK
jgi:hypothetical protein